MTYAIASIIAHIILMFLKIEYSVFFFFFFNLQSFYASVWNCEIYIYIYIIHGTFFFNDQLYNSLILPNNFYIKKTYDKLCFFFFFWEEKYMINLRGKFNDS